MMVDRRTKFGRLVDKIESPSKIWTDGRKKEAEHLKNFTRI